MKAFVFPGQGAQFPGMGKDLYEEHAKARDMFKTANSVLGFKITEVMFDGTADDLRQTKVTQPAVFLHSVILAKTMKEFNPVMVAGHSLGEFSALVANKTLDFEDGLKLVYKRALAMQEACEVEASTMAAIIGLDDEIVEKVCGEIDQIVVPANYNCPGQLVISGSMKGVELACEKLKEAGARRALVLPVGGAFHSPFMEPAREKLATAIKKTVFKQGVCPVYQNYTAQPVSQPEIVKTNLLSQLTSPVRWTQSVKSMIADGADEFVEVGPGNALQGMIRKIDRSVAVSSAIKNK